ncbi:MAG TPA: Fe-Mn family superoxide dismutase, partial [Candidatus Binatia bacterium]
VKETNRLTEKIWDFLKDGHVDQEEMPAYSELTRCLGFEYNGMVLHEYYFGNMSKESSSDPDKQSQFYQAAQAGFGSWATLHEMGNVAGFAPVLVMDVWEHAFLLDYKPAERPKYIDAFFFNIEWKTVEGRFRRIQ